MSGNFHVAQAYAADPDIAASIAEGERLIAEYNRLIAGSELTSSGKVKLILLSTCYGIWIVRNCDPKFYRI